jgi:hypothetical protein
VSDGVAGEGGGVAVSIVMGLDQHRAQIAAEWIETITGEVSRERIAPADRAGVRRFLTPFKGAGLPEFRSWWAFGSRFWGGCPVVAGFQGRRSPKSVGTHLAT